MSVDTSELSSERSSFYGEADESSDDTQTASYGPIGSVSGKKQKSVSEPQTPSNCKYNGNRNGEDPVELHSMNTAYLWFQTTGTLKRWLQQNGIPFSDKGPKQKLSDLVSKHYYKRSTPKPKRCGQWMRLNRTMPQLRRKGDRYTNSRVNNNRSVSQDEIHKKEDDDDVVMKDIDFIGIAVNAEEKMEEEDELMSPRGRLND